MRKSAICLALLCAVGLAGPMSAVTCTIDNRPAATLLLPYFEVDLRDGNGINTLFTVNNALPNSELTHVVLWSDLSVPVMDFNVYLTGFDMQTFDLAALIVNGQLPQTASTAQDPTDTISPKGVFSQDINFASCNGILPPPPLPPGFTTYLQAALTGKPAALLGGKCLGRNLGDRIARGYVTIDVVSNCTLRFPTDPGYFVAGGQGDATNANALFGDYTYVKNSERSAQNFTMVSVEADGQDARTSTPGNYTFYGRYVGWNASDNREPLPTQFGATYDLTTDAIVWRDPKVPQAPFTCVSAGGSLPSWYPLGEESIDIFDEQEHADIPQVSPVSPAVPGTLIPFPAAAQRTAVGGTAFPVPFTSGWTILDLNNTVAPAGSNPPADPAAAQGWVTVISKANGHWRSGHDALQFDSACQASHSVID